MDYWFLVPVEWLLNSYLGTIFVLFFLVYWLKEMTMGMCTAKTRLEGKVAVVTGGNTGIGFETAKELAARGARVIIGCRSRARGEQAVKKIIASTGNKHVEMMDLDLADLQTVKKFAEDFCLKEDRLDILVNNAGIGGFHLKEGRTLTKDNNEMVVQTNHLGHFLLTNLLKKPLTEAGSARVVNVSSQAHMWAKDITDINSDKEYDYQEVYGKSKRFNVLFSNELARRWKSLGVSSFSLHPGFVRTEIFNHMPAWALNFVIPLAYMVGKSTYQGAQTTLHCCLEPGLEEHSGTYWSDCRRFDSKNCQNGNWKLDKNVWDDKMAQEIWEKSATLLNFKE